ncbi:hypothetical protein [Pseudalkalibacillus sp. SCS-8]|uniref:hypothetical protein n=1 Tax=Pseudalkalibacillus nanhaiensis TaxID=3115291 RepID=UPI0032DA37ED
MKRKLLIVLGMLVSIYGIGDEQQANARGGVKVENLPTIFDDGTQVPEHIQWMTWEEANEIIPRWSKFEVVDFETGLYFKVQRRAGAKHADVQPLSKIDTAIMKEIYDGKWSWKRRAIFIRKGAHLIPASMHGMPHGAGALANNFPGHFCIHLPGSTTHRSSKQDPSHQLMIMKAAGMLDDYIQDASSEELLHVFIQAVNQEDLSIINRTINNIDKGKELDRFFIMFRKQSTYREQPFSLQVVEYPVTVIESKREGRMKYKSLLRLERSELSGRWHVNIDAFLQSLEDSTS